MTIMDSKLVGGLMAIVSTIGVLVQYGVQRSLQRWGEGGFEGPIPMIGTPGQTVTTYNLLIDVVDPLLIIILAVGLGYKVAHQVEIYREYPRVLNAIAFGSVAGVTLAGVPILYSASFPPGDIFTLFVLAASYASMVVSVGLVVIVSALAGSMLAHIRTDKHRPQPEMSKNDRSPARSDSD